MATEVTCIVDTGNGAGTHYTSLAAAIAGETGATPAVVTGANLVTADEQLTIKCRCTGGTADGAVTVNGFTTDATRYVKIWTDPTESYRHAGTYPSGNKYRIELPSATSVSGIRLTGTHDSSIIGISIQLNHSYAYAQRGIVCESATSGSVCKIDKCVIAGGSFSTASSSSHGIYCMTSNSMSFLVSNCVIYGLYTAGYAHNGIYFYSTGSSRVYNCTVYGCSGYGVRLYSSGTVHVKNSAVFGCALTDIAKNGGTLTVDYCASDDEIGTNAVQWTGGATDWANVFADYANGDFSLNNYTGTGAVIGAGTDDPGSGLYSDDILGNARTSPWDIGAFEYVAAGPATGALSGTASGSSSNVGGLGGIGVVAGGLAGTSAHQASVGGLAGLSGSVPAYATGSMSMGLIGLLSANASGASSASGGIGGIGLVSGLVQGSVTVTGGLVFDSISGELIGIISGGSMLAGTVHGIAELSGSVAGSSYVTGRIRYPSAPSESSSYRAIIGGMNQASVRMLSSRHVRRVGQ